MEININTTKVTSSGLRLAKSLLLVVFSAGWLYPLAGVILIPAGLLQEHLEESRQQMAASRPSPAATNVDSGTVLTASEYDARDAEFRSSPTGKMNRIDRQLHAIGELKISAIVLCGWLAMVIAYSSWKWTCFFSVRSSS